MTASVSLPEETLKKRQRAFLLHQLANLPDAEPLTQSAANKAKVFFAELDLTAQKANDLRAEMSPRLILAQKIGKAKSPSYSLTTDGKDELRMLEKYIPLAPVTGKQGAVNPPADDTQRKVREAFLLHIIQSSPDQTLTRDAAGKLSKAHGLGLSAGTVRAILTEFVLTDLVAVRRAANSESYTLTESGRARLTELADSIPVPAPPKTAKKSTPKVVEFADRELREAYLLDVLSRAANRTISQTDIDRAFKVGSKLVDKELAKTAADVVRLRGQGCFVLNSASTRYSLEQLVSSEYVEVTGEGDERSYAVTAAGLERLKDLRDEFPVLPPRGKPATADDEVMRNLWVAFVLLNVADAPDHKASESYVYAVSYPKGSKLNDATAWKLRGELAKSGYLLAEWDGKEASYTLTPAGLKYLAGLSFEAFDKLSIRGLVLTALLTAARTAGASTSPPSTSTLSGTHKGEVPSAPVMESSVIDILHNLLRGQYANIRMVPIHEVRAEIRRRHGDAAASQDVFNDLLLEMRRSKKVRLISIDDRSRATEQQLQDSVFAVGETFFYLETPHAPSTGG